MGKVTLKKPQAVVLEFTGCIATKAFMGDSSENRRFVSENIEKYFKDNYPKNRHLRMDVRLLYVQERDDEDKGRNKDCPKLPLGEEAANVEIASKAVIKHILWKLENDFHSPPLGFFLYHIAEWGYSKELIKTPVYDEVITVFKEWRSLNIDIYIAVASVDFIKMVLTNTTQGNLTTYFTGNVNLVQFDGQKTVKVFKKIPELISKPANSVLFITRLPLDARTATTENIPTVLIMREDFDPDAKRKRTRAKTKSKTDLTKKQDSKDKVEEDEGVSAHGSGLMEISSALQIVKSSKINESKDEELGKVLSLVGNGNESDEDHLDIRARGSQITTADIVELIVIDNLSDLVFETK